MRQKQKNRKKKKNRKKNTKNRQKNKPKIIATSKRPRKHQTSDPVWLGQHT